MGIEEERQRIEQEMTKLVNDLDLGYLRKMQADMHRCAAKCCDNQEISLENVQACVTRCSSKVDWAQNYVNQELSQLQNRLQRCVSDCNDDIRVQLGPNPSEKDITKFTAMFEQCATRCVDKQMGLVPNLTKRIKAELGKNLSQPQ